MTAILSETVFLTNCLQIFAKMLMELKAHNSLANEEERALKCFEHAATCKEQINALVRNIRFNDQSEEICFFKQIKPLFTAEVEFYTQLYHIALFKTREMDLNKDELNAYYKRQLLKKVKFRKEHPGFCTYVETGSTHADAQWFTSHQSKDSSLFDAVMGKYLAMEKLELYLQEKMNDLQ